ncbi:MAG: primosomal protein N' [Rhodocyclaceae bacterium]|nr:primosomal protein N' [Rhodocyclaceae bacterium]
MDQVDVAVDVPLSQCFTYLLEGLDGNDPCGRLVEAPFGAARKIGLVIGRAHSAPQNKAPALKRARLIEGAPALPREWLELVRFAAEYYQCPLGQAVAFALPPLLRAGRLPRGSRCMRPQAVPAEPPALNAEQAAALAAIEGAEGYACFLLHGVTGSGKTEVYLRAAAAALARGQQVLVLVPEIGLMPQLAARFAARFPERSIALATSAVAPGARTQAFLEALAGRLDIVIGTRLAVFTPMPRLGLIVVDEEHDPSYKQQEGFLFSARDLAVWRARQRQTPIVLGSATPALESYHHALTHRYRLLTLPARVGEAELPAVALIDTRREKMHDGVSTALLMALAENLARGCQSLVFLNRRGYAPVLACAACGWVSGCTRCAARLVVHLAQRKLICHHCGGSHSIPTSCPACGNVDLLPLGRGTQRIEARLRERFPDARIVRIDRDSAASPQKWQALLARIHEGAADILVGTQMLAKGHDFPLLTLVGVVGADASLYAADFRASERLFAQLMQVAGRAGRRTGAGRVLIQTEFPHHPLYAALIRHDYDAFARAQLAERESARFPPFSFQAVLRVHAHSMEAALGFLGAATGAVPKTAEVAIYEPVPMRLPRLKNRARAQVLVESSSRRALRAFLDVWRPALESLRPMRGLRWQIDVDPAEI